MFERRHKKSAFTDLIFSKFFLVFCVVIFLVILFGLAKGTIKNNRVDGDIQDLQAEIGRLERQNQEFGQLIDYLKSSEFVEQEAKLKLGLKKPGENLVIIPQDEIGSQPIQTKNDQPQSNPAKWWSYFFNL